MRIRVTCKSDKDLFECFYPEYQEQRCSSTFWDDFTIADMFGVEAVQDTFNRAFNEWKGDYKMLTELVSVLNHKIFQWYGRDEEVAKVYDGLWRTVDSYGISNLEGDELEFFTMVLD